MIHPWFWAKPNFNGTGKKAIPVWLESSRLEAGATLVILPISALARWEFRSRSRLPAEYLQPCKEILASTRFSSKSFFAWATTLTVASEYLRAPHTAHRIAI